MLTDTKTTGPTNFNLFIFSQVLRKIQFIHVIFNLLFSLFLRPIMTLLLSTVMFCMSTVFLRTCQNHLNLLSRISAEMGEASSLYLKTRFLILSMLVCHNIQRIHVSPTVILRAASDFFVGHLEKSFW